MYQIHDRKGNKLDAWYNMPVFGQVSRHCWSDDSIGQFKEYCESFDNHLGYLTNAKFIDNEWKVDISWTTCDVEMVDSKWIFGDCVSFASMEYFADQGTIVDEATHAVQKGNVLAVCAKPKDDILAELSDTDENLDSDDLDPANHRFHPFSLVCLISWCGVCNIFVITLLCDRFSSICVSKDEMQN